MADQTRQRQKAKTASKQPTTTEAVEPDIEQSEPVPELYVDGFMGLMLKDGVVKINLFSDVQDLVKERQVRRIVTRLIMPAPVLVAFEVILAQVVKDFEAAGVIKAQTTKKKG